MADFIKDLGLIEKYGSGIQRIMNYFQEEQMPAPEFQNISDGFMVTVFAKVVENVVENVGENEKLILQELGKNNKITAKGLADIIDLSERTVQRYLQSLQKQNKIKRIGPAKGGHWEVLDK